MTTIEIICTVIGAVASTLGGVYFILDFVFQKGKDKEHFANFEKTTMAEFTKIDKQFDKINKRMDKQEIETKNIVSDLEAKVEKKLDKFNNTLSNMHDTISLHTNALVEIYTVLGRKYPKGEGCLAQKNSPRKLTEFGQKIFNEVNGEKFLNDNKEVLYKYIEDHKPLTRLDVEELAQRALFMQTNTPIFNHIKDYVYEAPTYKNTNGDNAELTVGDICFVLSIPLRDMYLKDKFIQQ